MEPNILLLRSAGIDWDDGNRAKCRKHGVTEAEVAQVFADPGLIVLPDQRHSTHEPRLLAIGRPNQGRAVFVAFTMRSREGRAMIRPISVRYMHRREAARHGKEDDPPFSDG